MMGRLVAGFISLGILALILWGLGAFSSPGDNITCKQQQGQQYELCVQGQPHPVIVPYALWRSARVGGYYDEGTHRVFRSVNDDPHVSHGVFEDGGEGHVSVHGSGK